MAATLPGLPAELLLNICELAEKPRACYEQLRACSKTINNKIVRDYGLRFHKHIEIPLSVAGFERL